MGIADIYEIMGDYENAAKTYGRIVDLLEQEWGFTEETDSPSPPQSETRPACWRKHDPTKNRRDHSGHACFAQMKRNKERTGKTHAFKPRRMKKQPSRRNRRERPVCRSGGVAIITCADDWYHLPACL